MMWSISRRPRLGRAVGRSVCLTLQDRLMKELALAAITTVEAADCYIRDVHIAARNARLAVKAE